MWASIGLLRLIQRLPRNPFFTNDPPILYLFYLHSVVSRLSVSPITLVYTRVFWDVPIACYENATIFTRSPPLPSGPFSHVTPPHHQQAKDTRRSWWPHLACFSRRTFFFRCTFRRRTVRCRFCSCLRGDVHLLDVLRFDPLVPLI